MNEMNMQKTKKANSEEPKIMGRSSARCQSMHKHTCGITDLQAITFPSPALAETAIMAGI